MPTPQTYFDYEATPDRITNGFDIPFDYLEDEHVTIEVDGVVNTDTELTTGTPVKIKVLSAVTAGQNVRVRRKSQPDTNLVDFVNGSVLTESELDRAYFHNRYLNEEISELNDASLQIEAGGTDWDARTKKIKNLASPTLTTDATTKDYVDGKVNQAASGASSPPLKWVFTGTAGADTTYSVTEAEINGDTAYDVSIDGSVLEPTTDYTVDPNTDTLTIKTTLTGGENIVIIQRGFGIPISTGEIGSAQISADSITTAKIADGAVTNAKLATPYVHPNHTGDVTSTGDGATVIADDAVTSAKLADLNVTTGKIADLNVTTGKIADDAVTSAKLAHTAVTPGAYTSADITVDQQGRITAAASGSGGGAAGTPNWSTGWVNTDGTTSVANQATLQFTHNLGTTDLTTTIWVADDSSGTNAKEIRNYFHANAGGEYGATITDLTTTTLELQLLDNGWIAMNSSGQGPGLSFGSPESWSGYYVKVVASASATVGAISKYTAAWNNSHGGVTVANGSTHTITHNLGTTDVQVAVYVNTSASDSGVTEVSGRDNWSTSDFGASVTNLTSNSITLQLGSSGYSTTNSSGVFSAASYASAYIKVVVIGGASGSGGGAVSSFTSSETSIPATNTTETWTHGLGQAPDLIQLILRCKTAEYGYSVGDEVRFTSEYTYNIGIYTFWANATNIGFRQYIAAGSVFTIVDRSASNTIRNPTPANWKIVVKGVVL